MGKGVLRVGAIAVVLFGFAVNVPTALALGAEATAIVSSVKSNTSMRELCKGGMSVISTKVMSSAATLMATGTVTDPRTSGKEAMKELAGQCHRRK
jgi:hypothetical protein